MKELLIVRHAIAEDRNLSSASGMRDADRQLTDKGSSKMREIARVLHKILPSPGLLLSSPYLRTRQTAILLAELWQTPVEPCEHLAPGGDLEALLVRLADSHSNGLMVVVGHEPDLSELIGLLLCGKQHSFVRMKKGGAALIRLDEPVRPGCGELQWLMNPKQLLSPLSA